MRRQREVLALALALILVDVSESICQTSDSLANELRLQETGIAELLKASSIDSLTAVMNRFPYRDPVVKIIYSARRLSFSARPANELGLLDALPTSPIEADYFLWLCGRVFKDSLLNDQVEQLASDVIDDAAKCTLKHRRYIQKFFRFGASLGEGYMSEEFGDQACWVCEQDCVWYFRVLEKASDVVAKEIVSMMRTGPSLDGCVKKHRKEINSKLLDLLLSDPE